MEPAFRQNCVQYDHIGLNTCRLQLPYICTAALSAYSPISGLPVNRS